MGICECFRKFSASLSYAVATCVCVLILGIAGSAQEQPPAPLLDNQAVAPSAPHRFFDSVNLALAGAEVGALLADGITTQRALNRCPTVCWEANPVARPFVEAGWPGQIAGGTAFLAAEVGLQYLLHRKGHHRWERSVPVVLITYSTTSAIHNARVPHQVAGQ
jgi:hypothetical protein